jgi:hypothetical protein
MRSSALVVQATFYRYVALGEQRGGDYEISLVRTVRRMSRSSDPLTDAATLPTRNTASPDRSPLWV